MYELTAPSMRTLTRIAKWVLKWLSISFVLIIAVIILFLVFVIAPRYKSKGEVPHSPVIVTYREFLKEVGPEAQFESDTCGLHAIRVIYKAYGMDPDEENLRVRLGLDVPSNPADASSTGTLQPDMLRVLFQDGFSYRVLPLDDIPSAANTLVKHLEGGDMAVILISRRKNGNMHWVAARRMSGDGVVILDSLSPEPYPEDTVPFVRDCVLSCILIKPSEARMQSNGSTMEDGTSELLRTIIRYRQVKEIRAEGKNTGNSPPADAPPEEKLLQR